MWICLNDAFVSIVADLDDPRRLLCRARFAGDLQRAFRGALRGRRVQYTPTADYAYRVRLPRAVVADAVRRHVLGIDYPNFKASVADRRLHDAYLRVWTVMKAEQDRRLEADRSLWLFAADDSGPANSELDNVDELS